MLMKRFMAVSRLLDKELNEQEEERALKEEEEARLVGA
jgi:hypothetical protein